MSSPVSVFRLALAGVAAFVVGVVALFLTVYVASFFPALAQTPQSLAVPLLIVVAAGSGILSAIAIIDFRRAPPVPDAEKVEEALRIAASEPSRAEAAIFGLAALLTVDGVAEGRVTARFLAMLVAALWLQEIAHWTVAKALGAATDKVFTLTFLEKWMPMRGPRGVGGANATLLALVPGIGLAFLLVVSGRTFTPGLEREAALALLFVHALQLLPFGRLDGARIGLEALWLRLPWTEIACQIAAGAVLFMMASVSLKNFAFVAVAFTIHFARRGRLSAEAARTFRSRAPAFSGALRDAPGDYRDALVALAKERFGSVPSIGQDRLVRWLRDVHARATFRPASWPKAIVLVAAYFALAALVGLLLMVVWKGRS